MVDDYTAKRGQEFWDKQTVDRGMKYDGGKILAAIPMKDFNLAIKAVAEVGTFGANKYKRSSWKTVPDAALRYEDALVRHQLEKEEVDYDEESGLLHLAHMAWNALAILQLKLEEENSYVERPMTGILNKVVIAPYNRSMTDQKVKKAYDEGLQV